MSHRQLLQYIQELESAEDYALSPDHSDLAITSWLEAESDAVAAYEMWAFDRDPESYAVYRAYADQADAAQDALAAMQGRVSA
jgi:hypothetical protein